MKIFLTHAYHLYEDKSELKIMKPYVPLGILYISSYLKQHGLDVVLYDSTFRTKDEQRQRILELKPDIIAIYCNLMTKLNVLPLIKFIRSVTELNKSKIILGGPEPPFYAEEFLNYGADIIVDGEGEVTMKELCEELSKASPELSNVKGLIFRNDKNETIKTIPREQIKEINELPSPDRESVDIQLYLDAWKKAHGYSSVSINTMRGCPYTCRWCSHSVYGTTYRRRSTEKTADEIEWVIKKYNPDMLWFVDDVFTISRKWLFELEKIFSEKKIKIKFECITRSDRMNEEVIKSLKNLGCFRVWIGAESGSQRVLDLMDRRVKADNVREMIMLTKKYGIETGTFIMLGYHGEKINDIIETAEHLKSSDPDIFLTTVAYPIKGTKFYGEVESNLISELAWENRTDRDLDFKGRYSKKFYKHANRYLINEVNFYCKKKKGKTELKTYLKAKVSRLMMGITS
jgi:anaerobic magnesium-protoporphyrin IX monomethyl ester cyclase